MTEQLIKHIIVVGGGTAGWLAANHLAKRLHAKHPDGVRVTVIESKNIPTIGVGEGTVPLIRHTLQDLGISETQFIRECEVSFKQSIKFVDWENEPTGVGSNYYHHLFDYPNINGFDPTGYWLLGEAGATRYADAVSIQGAICDAGLAPKTMAHREYDGVVSYAYHLNAGKFGQMLATHAVEQLGVTRIFADISDARLSADGDIEALLTADGEEFAADFFVDCSGFSALLIQQKLQVPFIDKRDVLFVDSAIVMQVPYADSNAAIPCSTIATAKSAGWIWDIGLTSRRGVGYVYSSRYTDHETAERVFRDYVGPAADALTARRIPMQIGYRERAWQRNCVAIGLAGGFVEPLEATGLLMFDRTAKMLADLMPATKAHIPATAERFNRTVRFAWDRVIDFIKLHYCLSKRQDNAFWHDNRDPATIPASLLENLEHWRHQLPSHYDFTSLSGIFNLENFLYVLYGMNFHTKLEPHRFVERERARQEFSRMREFNQAATQQLVPHREMLRRIAQHGLQRI